jgi:hypothetical protein
MPGMTATRLARRLGLDRNLLRRRTDKIATCLAALLVGGFLIGAPWLAVAAVGWASGTGAARQQAMRSGRHVPSALWEAAPGPSLSRAASGYLGAQARWISPADRATANVILGDVGAAAGHTVPPSVDEAGSPAKAQRSQGTVRERQVAAAVVAVVGLGIVLLCLAWAGRLVLDRRRLANWEAAWAAVGPQWTKRFWSRG